MAEATRLIEQQMYLWGSDVLHPAGNLLKSYGCARYRRADLAHPVHLYRRENERVRVTLHSTGVALVLLDASQQVRAEESGVVYLRPHHRLYQFASHLEPPLPCPGARHVDSGMVSAILPKDMPAALLALLAWVRDYEHWSRQHVTEAHRLESWREFRKARYALRWMQPQQSLVLLDSMRLPAA